MTAWLAVALLGCPAKRKAPEPDIALEEAGRALSRRTPVEEGSYWSEPGGLCLEVPRGWSGTSGPEPHLLSLVNPATDIRFDLYAWPPASFPGDDRAGYTLVFDDDDSYRAVPILTPSGTATWRRDADQGPTITAWRAELGDRLVQVETTFPFGEATSGLDVVAPLLRGLCTTFR